MVYRILADLVVTIHFAFVIFAVLGGLLAFRRLWVVWTHVPAVLWAVWIEFTGGICPLTPLENRLRMQGGQAGYTDSFIGHYLLPVLYPADLTRSVQIVLGAFALVVNLGIYWRLVVNRRSMRHEAHP